jgi:hypothetical protein
MSAAVAPLPPVPASPPENAKGAAGAAGAVVAARAAEVAAVAARVSTAAAAAARMRREGVDERCGLRTNGEWLVIDNLLSVKAGTRVPAAGGGKAAGGLRWLWVSG